MERERKSKKGEGQSRGKKWAVDSLSVHCSQHANQSHLHGLTNPLNTTENRYLTSFNGCGNGSTGK